MNVRWWWMGSAGVAIAGLAVWGYLAGVESNGANGGPAGGLLRASDRAGGVPRDSEPSLPHAAGTGASRPRPAPRSGLPGSRGKEARSAEESMAPLAALRGLELITIDDGLRERLRVPRSDRIGRGVLVTRVHPDSPGAEIALQPRDVIVRARRRPVNDLSDLEDTVRGRDHTLLIVARDGRLYEMVLKPPFRP